VKRLRDEGGAVAIMMALIICLVLLPLGALAVDLGVQRVARTDMQSVADVVALDTARGLTGGQLSTYPAQYRNHNAIDAAGATGAWDSLQRNRGSIGDAAKVIVQLGSVDPAKYGQWDYFTEMTADTDVPSAVRILASTDVKFGLANGLPNGGISQGGAVRSAIATSASGACFDLGSYAAAIKSGDSSLLAPLNSLLGTNLSLLSYQGLANAQVSLAGLAADSHIGGVNQLLTTGVSFSNLVQASLDLLNKSDPAYSANVSAIGAILAASGTIGTVALGHQLSVSPDDTAALDTKMSVLDILTGAVLVANGTNAIQVANLWAHVAGLGNIGGTSLAMIQGKQHGCGQPNPPVPQATSSQLSGTVSFGQLNTPSVNIPGLATLQTSPATGVLTVNLGNATGKIVAPPDIHCGAGTLADPGTYTVGVTSNLASVDLSAQLTVSGKVTLGLNLVNLNIVVDIDINNTATGGTHNANLKVPPNDVTPVSTGSGVALSTANVTATIDPSSSATVLGLPISLSSIASTTNAIIQGLVDPTAPLMTNTLTPLISNINTLLTGPLAKLLGLTLAGADVYGYTPGCKSPKLAG
jgi:Flp pilus assembly protein TadG